MSASAEQRSEAFIQTLLNLDEQTTVSSEVEETMTKLLSTFAQADYVTLDRIVNKGTLLLTDKIQEHVQLHPNGFFQALVRELARLKSEPSVDLFPEEEFLLA